MSILKNMIFKTAKIKIHKSLLSLLKIIIKKCYIFHDHHSSMAAWHQADKSVLYQLCSNQGKYFSYHWVSARRKSLFFSKALNFFKIVDQQHFPFVLWLQNRIHASLRLRSNLCSWRRCKVNLGFAIDFISFC